MIRFYSNKYDLLNRETVLITRLNISKPRENQHHVEIDILKGIGIVLVVLGHVYKGSPLNTFIYSFHMPLFFFISGLLFKSSRYNSYGSFFKSKSKSLLLPYCTFYALSYLYWLLIERNIRPGKEVIALYKPLLGFFYGTDIGTYMFPNVALWFLTCLFITEIFLYFLVTKFHRKLYLLFAFTCSAMVGFVFNKNGLARLPWGISSSFMALFFTGLGYLSKPVYKWFLGKSHWFAFIASCLSFGFTYFISIQNQLVDMNSARYNSIFLFIPAAIFGIIGSFGLSKIIFPNKILEFVGINSLIIFGLSEPIKRVCIGVFSLLTHFSIDQVRYSILLSLICTGITILALVPVIYIFNTYLFFTIAKRKR